MMEQNYRPSSGTGCSNHWPGCGLKSRAVLFAPFEKWPQYLATGPTRPLKNDFGDTDVGTSLLVIVVWM